MRVTHYNNIDFNIDDKGNISRKSIWHVMDDDTTAGGNWTGLRDLAEEWAGSPGDDWRIPGSNSQSYTTDDSCVITGIEFKALSRFMYEVEFTGIQKHLEAEMIGNPDIHTSQSAEVEKSAKWRVHADSIDDLLPAIGDILSWAGELYMCAEIDCSSREGGEYDVSLRAKDMSVLMIGNPVFIRNSKLESEKSAKWRVSTSAYDEFLETYDINSDASSWAGDGYYVTELNADPVGALGYYVEVKARHIGVKLLDISKTVEYKGYDLSGNLKTAVVYIGKWQVHIDSQDQFNDLCGESAEDWAEENFTVVSVNPVRISEIEYEYTLKARDLDSDTSGLNYEYDPRDNLSSRNDVTAFPSEFTLSPEQCGWMLQNGNFIKLNDYESDSWDSDSDCPFNVSNELNRSLINRTLPTLGLEEITYYKGNGAKHVSKLANWDSSSTVLKDYTIGNYSGNWRKLGQKSSMELDNRGDTWTKITRYYQKAPGDYTWNSGYSGFTS